MNYERKQEKPLTEVQTKAVMRGVAERMDKDPGFKEKVMTTVKANKNPKPKASLEQNLKVYKKIVQWDQSQEENRGQDKPKATLEQKLKVSGKIADW